MAVGDFCAVSDVKNFLAISKTIVANDPLIQQIVTAVSTAFRSSLNRDILSKGYTELRDGTGTATLVLRNFPLTAVSSLQIGNPGAWTTLAQNTDFVISPYSVKLLGPRRFPQGIATVQIAYTAGYMTVPADLSEKAAKTAALRYKQLSRLGQESKSIGGETIRFDVNALPSDVKDLLEQYKRRAIIPAA